MELELKDRIGVLVRSILPEGRLLFRALAYGLLAGCAFALPISGAWWAGLFLSYMALNLLIGRIVANASDMVYRVLTGQPIDTDFIRWLGFLEQFCDAPEDAYQLYASGLTPRQAWETISHRADTAIDAS